MIKVKKVWIQHSQNNGCTLSKIQRHWQRILGGGKEYETFQLYLFGRSFLLRIDHKFIEYLNTNKKTTGRFLP